MHTVNIKTANIRILYKGHHIAAPRYRSVINLLDLSAAFDNISHIILIWRLSSIGISGTVLKWFISCISDRNYRVNIKYNISIPRKIIHGVLRDSVLGTTTIQYLCNYFFQNMLKISQNRLLFIFRRHTYIL